MHNTYYHIERTFVVRIQLYKKGGLLMRVYASTIIVFVLYLAFMLGIGIYFYKKGKDGNEDLSDYLLGGRDLNPWVAALSAGASDMSGWLLMGLPGAAYLSGYSAGWIGIGLGIGTWVNWQFVAKRFRIYTELSGNSITLSDYFENRFKDNSKILRMVSAVFILFFFFVYTSSGFVAGAKLFNVVFGIDYIPALILGAIVILSYTILGGFAAVSWTDFFHKPKPAQAPQKHRRHDTDVETRNGKQVSCPPSLVQIGHLWILFSRPGRKKVPPHKGGEV